MVVKLGYVPEYVCSQARLAKVNCNLLGERRYLLLPSLRSGVVSYSPCCLNLFVETFPEMPPSLQTSLKAMPVESTPTLLQLC